MTRTLLPAFTAGLLLASGFATGFAPGFAPGLAIAGDSAMVLKVDAIQYYYCTVNGGEETWEDGDDIRTCEYDDGTFVWCDADYSDCEYVLPAPGPRAATSTSNTSTETATPTPDGAYGNAPPIDGTLQLQR